ncbi:unnamed protein product [Sphagnum troendelagicum]|uniref:Uncharacterized protein n=1 Tax=Sphagnum troendelagicum TaxID=128251 RepID=A0ABP0URZ5_9BRYO
MSRTVQQQQQQPSVYLSSLVLFISQHQRPRTYARASGSHHRLPVSQSALLRQLVTTAVLGGVFRLIALESYRLRQPVGRSSVWLCCMLFCVVCCRVLALICHLLHMIRV